MYTNASRCQPSVVPERAPLVLINGTKIVHQYTKSRAARGDTVYCARYCIWKKGTVGVLYEFRAACRTQGMTGLRATIDTVSYYNPSTTTVYTQSSKLPPYGPVSRISLSINMTKPEHSCVPLSSQPHLPPLVEVGRLFPMSDHIYVQQVRNLPRLWLLDSILTTRWR